MKSKINRDLVRDTLNEQKNDLKKHFLIKQIDQWEVNSIEMIQQIAKQCRERIFQHTNEHFKQMEVNLTKLTDLIREFIKTNTSNEIDLTHLKQKVAQLKKDLDKISNLSIQQIRRHSSIKLLLFYLPVSIEFINISTENDNKSSFYLEQVLSTSSFCIDLNTKW